MSGNNVVVVTRVVNSLTVAPIAPRVGVASPGPQGVPGATGPAGAPGGSFFEHVQSVASASWVINHNQGRKVHVSVFDDTGHLIGADVEHGSLNQTTVTWAQPVTGSAVIS